MHLFYLQGFFIRMHVKHAISYLYVQPSSWRRTLRFETCRRHRGEKIKNENINLEKVHFVGLYCTIILQCTVQKKINKKNDTHLVVLIVKLHNNLHKGVSKLGTAYHIFVTALREPR